MSRKTIVGSAGLITRDGAIAINGKRSIIEIEEIVLLVRVLRWVALIADS